MFSCEPRPQGKVSGVPVREFSKLHLLQLCRRLKPTTQKRLDIIWYIIEAEAGMERVRQPEDPASDISMFLRAWRDGNQDALDRLMPGITADSAQAETFF